jgi:large subunit ribosomal protein L6
MKNFLFNKNFIELHVSSQKKSNNISIDFINKLNGSKDFFIFEKKNNFFSVKKILQKFYISNVRGFVCLLELIGLGFSVTAKQNILRFNVGFNHSIYYKVPQDVIVRSKRKSLFIFSNSFFSLRKVVIDLKNFRKLSIYKLKGIKEKDDLYIKKN